MKKILSFIKRHIKLTAVIVGSSLVLTISLVSCMTSFEAEKFKYNGVIKSVPSSYVEKIDTCINVTTSEY